MTRPIIRLILAAILVAIGGLCWAAADAADQLAARHERLATLQTTTSSSSGRWTAWLERMANASWNDEGTHATMPAAAGDYWAGRYDAIAARENTSEADEGLLLTAANAAFRKAQREAGMQSPSIDRLDQVLQEYASVLKNGGFNRDAAYNFEYIARLRDHIARAKTSPVAPQLRPRVMARPNDDLPSGPTVHGARGTHPPGTKGEEFEIMTPMDYGEREAQPEATPGRPLPRKG